MTASGGWALVWAGLLFGLAQQQHPTMLLFWPVFLGYVGWRGRAYFRTRWAYAAILAFLVGISPLILYNLVATELRQPEGVARADERLPGGSRQGLQLPGGRAIEIAQTLPRIVASAVDLRPAPAEEYLRDPRVLAYTVLAVVGLVAAARLGAWSLPLAVMTFLLLLPLFPASHDNLPRQGRYLMPLLPLAFARGGRAGGDALATGGLCAAGRRVRRAAWPWPWSWRWWSSTRWCRWPATSWTSWPRTRRTIGTS